jgi:hypothetical protein
VDAADTCFVKNFLKFSLMLLLTVHISLKKVESSFSSQINMLLKTTGRGKSCYFNEMLRVITPEIRFLESYFELENYLQTSYYTGDYFNVFTESQSS